MDRYEKVAKLLSYKGVTVSDEQLITLDFKFIYNTPSNQTEILNNMKTQFEMNAISTETILENSPYIKDTVLELTRLNSERGKKGSREESNQVVDKDDEGKSNPDENAEEKV